MADQNSTTTTNEFREDLLKLAAAFLSSNKVQTAEKSKKVAFLKSKGLTDDEIVEAFQRLQQESVTLPTITETVSNGTLTNTTEKPTTHSSSSGLTFTPPPTTMIPESPLEPRILYHPAPTAPKVPARQVFALAIILGVGVTGVACGMIGIVKRLLYPVFTTYAGYKHSRYIHHTTMIEKVKDTLDKDIKEEMDQDELDSLDKPGIYQLIKNQETLVDRLNKIVIQTQSLRHSLPRDILTAENTLPASKASSDPLIVLGQSLKSLSEAMISGLQPEEKESASVSDMKNELRRLKGICLNRRHV